VTPAQNNKLKTALFVAFVIAVVSVPFVLFGDSFVLPLLESKNQQIGWLIVISIILLAADSVAPVPATLVIMFLAAKGGRAAGIIGGTVGMSAGVLAAAWFGRSAVGRIAPKFFPDAEVARLRALLQRRLTLTLACLRSVPVLAETSVIVAAAMGIPVREIFLATLLPNFVVSIIYSVAADDSFATASITFVATMVASSVLWLWLRKKAPTPPST
jgi:3-dehydroquinate synthase